MKRCCLIALGGALVFSLSACELVPQAPLDQPISMSVRGEEPVFMWCGESATITGVKVHYSTSPSRSKRILNETTSARIEHGQEIEAPGLNSVLADGVSGRGMERLTSVGVVVEYRRLADEVEGSFIAEYPLSYDELQSFPESTWIWATGERSNDPCGMASAR